MGGSLSCVHVIPPNLTKMQKKLCKCLLLLVAIAFVETNSQCQRDGGVLDVFPTSLGQGRGCSLNDALGSVGHNTVLNLQPGQHRLVSFILVGNRENVTLAGNGSTESVTITCIENMGLAFLSMSNLTFRNLTIQNCGLAGSGLDVTFMRIQNNFFFVPFSTQVALLIALSVNVELTSVNIKNSDGIGLLVMDTLGTITVVASTFTSNSPMECYSLSYENGIGGGAVFNYFQNTSHPTSEGQLIIRNSTFKDNSNCNAASTFELYSQYASVSDEENITYIIGGGGGLSVYASQYSYPVSVEIEECYFQNNTARFGGGVFIGMLEGVNNFSVTILNTNFISNGLDNTQQFSLNNIYSETNGAALSILKDIPYLPGIMDQPSSIQESNSNLIQIQECVFEHNLAYSGGAVIILSHYLSSDISTAVVFKDCEFTDNLAYIGAAGLISEQKSNGVQVGMSLVFHDCKFVNNSLITPNHTFLSTTIQSSSILEIVAMNMSFQGHTRFSTNRGTPIHTSSTVVNIQGTAIFTLNTGAFGGAMGLTSSSFLVVHNNSRIEFSANLAYVQGGALFIDYQGPGSVQELVYYDCFLFFDKLAVGCLLYEQCPNHLEGLNITLNFSSNDAPLGTAVFGSALETCQWLEYLIQNRSELQNLNPYGVLVNIGVAQFHPALNSSTNTISTPPNTLEANNTIVSLMPGEIVLVNVTAFDRLNQTVPNPITSTVVDSLINGPYISRLGSSGYWFLDRQTDNSFPLTILARHEPNYSVNVSVGIYSLQSTAQLVLPVSVQPCYPGFVFPNSSDGIHHQCECDKELLNSTLEIHCNPATANIAVPNQIWVGNVSEGELAVANCFPTYCHTGVKNVVRGDFDSQCVNSRTGILCGQCRKGYSVTLGYGDCLQCSNTSLVLLISFILMGLGLMFKLGRFDVTVKHGLLNSVLFYSNIVSIYRPFLIIQKDYYPLFVITSLLSLNLGFEACFFDGMTALHAAYLYFVFPAYLWLLMGMIALLVKYNRWPKLWLFVRKNNAISTFATLMLMTYVTTLQNCANALSFVVVDKIGIRWAIDPSVEYFSGDRIPLIIISLVVIFIYIIPAPILLLFPALTMRLWIGRKLLPIYDVLWAPFREKFHFWVGLRLVLRILPFVFGYFITSPLNLLFLGIFIGLYLLAHITFMPFKLVSRNYLDTYLTINLFLLTFGATYFNENGPKSGQLAYVVVLLFLAYSSFFVVFAYHFYNGYLKDHEKFKKFQAAVVSKFHKWNNDRKIGHWFLHRKTAQYLPTNDEGEVTFMGGSRDLVSNQYREPLLSDSELEVYPAPSPSSSRAKPKNKASTMAVTSNEIPAPTDECGELSLRVNTS